MDSGKDINVMEFRKLTISYLPSLLELYKQLDEDDEQRTFEQSEMVWKEIEENSNIQYFGAIEKNDFVKTYNITKESYEKESIYNSNERDACRGDYRLWIINSAGIG